MKNAAVAEYGVTASRGDEVPAVIHDFGRGRFTSGVVGRHGASIMCRLFSNGCLRRLKNLLDSHHRTCLLSRGRLGHGRTSDLGNTRCVISRSTSADGALNPTGECNLFSSLLETTMDMSSIIWRSKHTR